jgi:hypothetical protein
MSGDVSVTGNLNMGNSTSTAGNVLKGGVLFLHNAGAANVFLGENAGNLTVTGNNTTAVGANALNANTTGCCNTATGNNALLQNTTGGGNTASGDGALYSNTTGSSNTATGRWALITNTTGFDNTSSGWSSLYSNTTGADNTAQGVNALYTNTTGNFNTAIGFGADVSQGSLSNTTAIGYGAIVNASNKIRLGNSSVTVIEGQVPYTYTSDKNQKENFAPIDGEAVLAKLANIPVSSWNYIGQDARQFRHYGPVAQDFFAAFGHDAIGTVGTASTLNSGDMAGILMIGVQTLQDRTEKLVQENMALRTELMTLSQNYRELRATLKQDPAPQLEATSTEADPVRH